MFDFSFSIVDFMLVTSKFEKSIDVSFITLFVAVFIFVAVEITSANDVVFVSFVSVDMFSIS